LTSLNTLKCLTMGVTATPLRYSLFKKSSNFCSANLKKNRDSICFILSAFVKTALEISSMCNAKISALFFLANMDAASKAYSECSEKSTGTIIFFIFLVVFLYRHRKQLGFWHFFLQ